MAAQRRVGAFGKLLANYASDDAIIAAGEAAELLFCRAVAFCSTSDSDGYITDAQLLRYVGAGMKDAPKRAAALVREGLWQRADGGYQVRSWLKIHPSTEEKGYQLKTDRERKAKARPSGVRTESARNPDGIQNNESPDSLSLIQSSTDQSTTETGQGESSVEGKRPETLPAPAATEHTPTSPTDARCTAHRGVADPGPCNGCRVARERAEREVTRFVEQQRRDFERRARNCGRCDGAHVVDEDGKPTRRKCDHRRAS